MLFFLLLSRKYLPFYKKQMLFFNFGWSESFLENQNLRNACLKGYQGFVNCAKTETEHERLWRAEAVVAGLIHSYTHWFMSSSSSQVFSVQCAEHYSSEQYKCWCLSKTHPGQLHAQLPEMCQRRTSAQTAQRKNCSYLNKCYWQEQHMAEERLVCVCVCVCV